MSKEITIRPTIEDMQQSRNLLHFDPYAIFVQCWRIDADQPLNPKASGQLFVHISMSPADPNKALPRCILGTEPTEPYRFRVQLVTTPAGFPKAWTANDIAEQEMYVHLPQCLPWLGEATSFHLAGRHLLRDAKPCNRSHLPDDPPGDPRENRADTTPATPDQPAKD